MPKKQNFVPNPPLTPTLSARVERVGATIIVNRPDDRTLGIQVDLVGAVTLADLAPMVREWVAQTPDQAQEAAIRRMTTTLRTATTDLALAIRQAHSQRK